MAEKSRRGAHPVPSDLTTSDDIELLRLVGETLFGPHWRRYLPQGLGMSESHLVALAAKRTADGSPRRRSPRMRQRLLDFCAEEPARVMATATHQVQILLKVGAAIQERGGK